MSEGQRDLGAESRERLLTAGAALIHELPTRLFLRSLTARAVATRAGYTQGAFYHHWDTQEAYVSELVDWMLDPTRAVRAEAVNEAEVMAAELGTAEAIGAVAVASVHQAMRSESFVAQIALWAHHTTSEIVRIKIRDLQRLVSANNLAAIRYLFSEHGWAPAAGLSEEAASEAMVALIRGLALRCAVDEDVDPAIAGAAITKFLAPPVRPVT